MYLHRALSPNGHRAALVNRQSLDTTSTSHTATLTGTGTVAASLIVTPDSLSFGSQATGTTSAVQTVTVTNVGSSAIQISSAGISGSAFATASDQCSAATLLPGQNCTVGVTFSPSATGPASGTLTIASDAPEGSHAVALSGTGVAPPTGTISLTPASHAFASQPIGTTSGAQTFTVAHTGGGPVALGAVTIADDGVLRGMLVSPGSFDFGVQATGVPSAAQEFVVVNTESAALLLGAISLGGPNASDYLLVGESCGGATLLPGEQCSLGVVFLPTGTGPSVATVTIAHNADGGSYAIGLAGNGGVAVDGGVVASAATTEFAVADNTCAGVTLGSGESCTFGVTFSPAAGDERAATLSVASDAGNGPHSVALSG
ncbi:MAG: choice-of-anchor D domain-containing protein [Chloroflexia bacterium]